MRRDGVLDTDWSCARSKRIRKGDRVFLLRQGKDDEALPVINEALAAAKELPEGLFESDLEKMKARLKRR